MALSALLDGDQRVQAAGVGALPRPLPETARQAVIDTLLAWLIAGGPDLAAATARHLPNGAPDLAQGPLMAPASGADHPLAARIAATTASADLGASGDLITLLSSATQQARMVALKALTDMARGEGTRAPRPCWPPPSPATCLRPAPPWLRIRLRTALKSAPAGMMKPCAGAGA